MIRRTNSLRSFKELQGFAGCFGSAVAHGGVVECAQMKENLEKMRREGDFSWPVRWRWVAGKRTDCSGLGMPRLFYVT